MSKPQGSSEERPLFIALAHHPFMSFKDGVKYVELRKDAPRWADKHVRPGRAVTLSRGYGKADRLGGWVGRVVRAPDMRLLPPWALDGAALDRTIRVVAYDRV